MRTRVRDVMTSPVETVTPTASLREVVQRLRTRAISAVPVIDQTGRVVGVVSEADVLVKADRATIERHRSFLEGRRSREARARAAASTAGELMTSPAVTIGPDAPLARAARLMRKHGVKRLPVVDEEGRAVGIVSRVDLLKVFTRCDEEIQSEIVDDVITRTLLLDPTRFTVTVAEGVVTLSGAAERRSEAILLARLAAQVEGVVNVHGELTYRRDDGDLGIPRPGQVVYPIRF